MPLVCSRCGKDHPFGDFIQVSFRIAPTGHARLLRQRVNGIHVGEWIPYEKAANQSPFPREEGIYCQRDGAPVLFQLILPEEQELIKDKRFPLSDVDSASLVNDLISIASRLQSEVYVHVQPERAGSFSDIEMAGWMRQKIRDMGIEQLYTHQVEAIQAIRAGKNVIICTPTASGKSLAYTIPILETLCNDSDATALYLSPYKALVRDQFGHLIKWSDGEQDTESLVIDGYASLLVQGYEIGIGILEGDRQQQWPKDQSKDLTYSHGRIWLTNVHFLHYILRGVVDFKQKKIGMARFLKHLRYVVVDEMHVYSGIFGSKVAMVLRRLRMLCERLGNRNLQFIACSATIGNPKELAEELTGKKGIQGFVCITGDYVPQKRKTILLWNPGINPDGKKRAMVSELYEILRSVYQHGRWPRTIIFAQTRMQAQQLSRDLNQIVRAHLKGKEETWGQDLFLPYHAHLPYEVRKKTIQRLNEGELLGVVTTNALEAGIDIHLLDLCIMLGYPGSQAAFWQQAGRVGRNREGIVVMLLKDEPLQQYFSRKPEEFFQMPPEAAAINTSNLKLLSEHLRYAAHEQRGECYLPQRYFRSTRIRSLLQQHPDMWQEDGQRWIYKGESPSYQPLIPSQATYTVVKKKGWNKEILLEGVDQWTQIRDYHYDAVFPGYDNQSYYRVRYVDYNNREVIVEPVKTDYYTRGIVRDSIEIRELYNQQVIADPLLKCNVGNILIKRYTFGYQKHFLQAGKKPESVQMNVSHPVSFLTDACWFIFEAEGREWLKQRVSHLMDDFQASDDLLEASLHVVEHAIASAVPVLVKCSSADFHHVSSYSGTLFFGMPGVMFYENHFGGGCGIAEAIVEQWPALLARAMEMVQSCHCLTGCPSCIQLFHCERQNENLFKRGGLVLLEGLLELAKEFVGN